MAADTATLVDFALPSLGSDMEEGTVLEWLVAIGDAVIKGDVLLRVDTEKSEIDVEVWHDGVVAEILAQPGDTIPVGTSLARLAPAGTEVASAPTPARSVTEVQDETPVVERPQEPTRRDVPPAAPRALPPKELSKPTPVSSNGGPGSGVAVGPKLVFWPSPSASMAGQPQALRPASAEPVVSRAARRQAAVASLMERSNTEIPHFHVIREMDVTTMLTWLEERNASRSPTERILPAAVMLYAVAQAASSSAINGTYDGAPIDSPHVNLGVAVHVRGGGLMTPVLPAADDMALDTLMWELQAMVSRARAGRLSTRDMTAATLTVTNLGDSGADRVLGVIRPPERALVGFGRVADRPVVLDGDLVVRSTVEVTLTADHRVVNGYAGARFLEALNTILSQPHAFKLADSSPAEGADQQ